MFTEIKKNLIFKFVTQIHVIYRNRLHIFTCTSIYFGIITVFRVDSCDLCLIVKMNN